MRSTPSETRSRRKSSAKRKTTVGCIYGRTPGMRRPSAGTKKTRVGNFAAHRAEFRSPKAGR